VLVTLGYSGWAAGAQLEEGDGGRNGWIKRWRRTRHHLRHNRFEERYDKAALRCSVSIVRMLSQDAGPRVSVVTLSTRTFHRAPFVSPLSTSAP